ncbi:GDA1/CD39 (nucleoside phosphatase) family protein [Besnoitia besnoiti]|uniref:GDA1/CD39 (Nucleoside phosphatase) family protein n=1 Tax=Besnoitia besnoiti TaxID=94643 RepID=A0A2A9MIK1_BESBE|nr:GDA1/CD39 (nucleoside phosphatase) family protein [Besnoitia besnoiti]PFH35230.1 GDA1/CD39 (nucleoside phosphatase) family protein [Besnoitia besnoiti]
MELLRRLRYMETTCTFADQVVVVVDGGSTGTRAQLFAITTQACPRSGRVVLPQKLRFLGTGRRMTSLRQLLESWLDEHAPGWESRADVGATITKHMSKLQMRTDQLVMELKQDVANVLNKRLNEQEIQNAKQLGVPLIVHSTAGVRDFPEWYVDGLFLLLRSAINQPASVDGYTFFTNTELGRPITGEEEGLFAFFTLNFLSKRLPLFGGQDPARQTCSMAGLVEVGGASLQIVLPIDDLHILPSFVKTSSVKRCRGQCERPAPRKKVLSLSFMQLGSTSAAGLLFKGICRQQQLKNGICHNPCLPRGYEQPCSAGPPKFSPDGTVHIDTQLRKNRLIPAATYCSATNPAISVRPVNVYGCAAIGMDPFSSLENRLGIEGCTLMVGTGNFDACFAEVEAVLLNPSVPLPANLEASSAGFDSLGQVSRLVSTSVPVFITGTSILDGIRTLQKIGFLRQEFRGEVAPLVEAAEAFCRLPVKFAEGKGLIFDLPSHELPVTAFTITFCHELAMAVGLLKYLQAGKHVPSDIIFTDEVVDDAGIVQGKIGWPLGAVLYRALSQKRWSRDMYELGPTVNFYPERKA